MKPWITTASHRVVLVLVSLTLAVTPVLAKADLCDFARLVLPSKLKTLMAVTAAFAVGTNAAIWMNPSAPQAIVQAVKTPPDGSYDGLQLHKIRSNAAARAISKISDPSERTQVILDSLNELSKHPELISDGSKTFYDILSAIPPEVAYNRGAVAMLLASKTVYDDGEFQRSIGLLLSQVDFRVVDALAASVRDRWIGILNGAASESERTQYLQNIHSARKAIDIPSPRFDAELARLIEHSPEEEQRRLALDLLNLESPSGMVSLLEVLERNPTLLIEDKNVIGALESAVRSLDYNGTHLSENLSNRIASVLKQRIAKRGKVDRASVGFYSWLKGKNETDAYRQFELLEKTLSDPEFFEWYSPDFLRELVATQHDKPVKISPKELDLVRTLVLEHRKGNLRYVGRRLESDSGKESRQKFLDANVWSKLSVEERRLLLSDLLSPSF